MALSRTLAHAVMAVAASANVAGAFLLPDTVRVDMAQGSVVVAPGSALPLQLAARELVEHVALATGTVIPVLTPSQAEPPGYRLHVGVVPSGARARADDGSSGYVVAETAAFFFGTGAPGGVGTLAAVREFLRRECGVRWLAPGAAGTVFTGDLRNLRLRPRQVSVRAAALSTPLAFAPQSDPAFVAALARLQSDIPAHAVAKVRSQWVDWLQRNGLRATSDAPAGESFAAWVTGLPVGQDGRLPEALELPWLGPAGATRIECPLGGWGLSTLAAYTLVGRCRDRAARVTDLADEYYTAYGPGADDVRDYHDFWRRLHAERDAPLLPRPTPDSRFVTEYGRRLHEFFFLEDFRTSSIFLHDALLRGTANRQRDRLQMLLLAHEHAEMTFLAISALNQAAADPARAQLALEQARRLHHFRREFAGQFGPWPAVLSAREVLAGDASGHDLVEAVGNATVRAVLPDLWHVKPDSRDAGEEQKWAAADAGEFTTWPQVALAEAGQRAALDPPIVWLAAGVPFRGAHTEGAEVALCVWAMTAPCTFYVNGQEVGRALPDMARPTLALRCNITSALDSEATDQRVVVRAVFADAPRPLWRGAWIVQASPPSKTPARSR